MGQENPALAKEEDHDSTQPTLSPPASPMLLVFPKPSQTKSMPKRARAVEHSWNGVNHRNKKRKRHIADTKAENPAKPEKNAIVIDLVSDDENSESPVKDETFDDRLRQSLPKEPFENKTKYTTANPIVSSSKLPQLWHQSPFKPEFSPEIIPFSQVLIAEDSHRVCLDSSPESNFSSHPSLIFDLEGYSPLSLLNSETTRILSPSELSSLFDNPAPQSSRPQSSQPQSSQQLRQRKLKSISSDWTQRFVERQRSPPRRAARRKQLKAKRPLTIPKLSGGKRFRPRHVYQEFGTRSTINTIRTETQIEIPDRSLPSAYEAASDRFSTQRKDITYRSEYENPKAQLSNTKIDAESLKYQYTSGFSRLKTELQKPSFLKAHSEIMSFALGASTFSVYADFIRWHCPLLAEEYQHTRGHSILPKWLEDVDTEVFGLFINWLYTE
ncbi:hypothetical protein DL98DRAFT_597568 [Cadophora sp. DSE1049]|nr:hypothetical protein DL98DRAFT_597568 [Cadophora sp. DSE1049]